jgi:hypothetical protein
MAVAVVTLPRVQESGVPCRVLYRAMDMTFWLEQAEAALARVDDYREGEPNNHTGQLHPVSPPGSSQFSMSC